VIVFVRKMRQSALPTPPAWALRAFRYSLHQPFLRVLVGSIAQKGRLKERHCAGSARKNHVRLITMAGFHDL
jgi:hypothetical protein